MQESLKDSVNRLGWLHFAAHSFQDSIYHQKHAFYFHNVEQWVARLWVSASSVIYTGKTNSCPQRMGGEI